MEFTQYLNMKAISSYKIWPGSIFIRNKYHRFI